MHPLEAILLQLPLVSFLLVYTMDPISIVSIYIFFIIGTVHGHSNFDPFGHLKSQGFINRYNQFHQLHHKNGHGNFGFIGTHWDKVFGSVLSKKQLL